MTNFTQEWRHLVALYMNKSMESTEVLKEAFMEESTRKKISDECQDAFENMVKLCPQHIGILESILKTIGEASFDSYGSLMKQLGEDLQTEEQVNQFIELSKLCELLMIIIAKGDWSAFNTEEAFNALWYTSKFRLNKCLEFNERFSSLKASEDETGKFLNVINEAPVFLHIYFTSLLPQSFIVPPEQALDHEFLLHYIRACCIDGISLRKGINAEPLAVLNPIKKKRRARVN